MAPVVVALTATVVLLVWMGFFMMGSLPSLPSLVLLHDTPLDALRQSIPADGLSIHQFRRLHIVGMLLDVM